MARSRPESVGVVKAQTVAVPSLPQSWNAAPSASSTTPSRTSTASSATSARLRERYGVAAVIHRKKPAPPRRHRPS